jgi:hypothetical protein
VKGLRAFTAGVLDFVVGDDVPLALGIVLTIAVTYALGRSGTHIWWLPPVMVGALVALSIWRVVRKRRPSS